VPSDSSRCPFCELPVVYAKDSTGKEVQLDAEPQMMFVPAYEEDGETFCKLLPARHEHECPEALREAA
jgi:hypothetical protein